MLMKMVFSGFSGDNLEEFRKTQKNIRKLAVLLAALGALTIAFGALVLPRLPMEITRVDFFSGFYCGVGAAVLAVGVVLFVNTGRLLKDEAQLKRAFTEQHDERLQQISTLAMRNAGLVLVFLLYVAVLVCGVFYPELFYFCCAAATLYCLLVIGFRAYYNKRL